MFKTAKMSVHDIERHLDRVKFELVFRRQVQHVQMNRWVFMSGESDITNFTGLFSRQRRFQGATGREDPIRVVHPNDFMKLQQVDVIRLQAFEAFIDLSLGTLPTAAIDLGHQENTLPVPVAERTAHANFTFSVVVIPAIIHERKSSIDGGPDDFSAFTFKQRISNMEAAQPDGGDFFAGATQGSVNHIIVLFFFGPEGASQRAGGDGGRAQFHKFSARQVPTRRWVSLAGLRKKGSEKLMSKT